MRVVVLPVQFRTVHAALASGLDAAVTVADEMPATIRRRELFRSRFVCLFDARRAKLRRLTEADYFAREHVIVSYNGDLRGLIEDMLRKQRRVRCSVSSFTQVGVLIEGTSMLATVPEVVARHLCAVRPHLRTLPLPFRLAGGPMELLWPAAGDDDEPGRFVRERIVEIAQHAASRAG